jgi:hypothetical protein
MGLACSYTWKIRPEDRHYLVSSRELMIDQESCRTEKLVPCPFQIVTDRSAGYRPRRQSAMVNCMLSSVRITDSTGIETGREGKMAIKCQL